MKYRINNCVVYGGIMRFITVEEFGQIALSGIIFNSNWPRMAMAIKNLNRFWNDEM